MSRKRFAACFLISVLAAGCDGGEEPRGQVVAIVDGVEITVAELNEEARARGLAIARDPQLRQAMVQELVDRKLLIQEARRQGFDRSPQYLLAKRRAEEILLGQQLLAASAEAWTPSAEELKRFIANNPHAFQARTQFRVSAVRLPAQVPEGLRRALASAPNLQAMQQLLARAAVRGAPSMETWDSASLPADWAKTLLRLEPGQTFVLSSPTASVAGAVVAKEPQPVSAERQVAEARAMLDRQRREMILQRIVGARRNAAEIRYHPDFAPGSPAS